MQAKNKKKKTTIHTTQPREVRLRRGKMWLKSYEGRNKVTGYAKKYKVDLLTAISDLRILGVEISAEYETAVHQTIEQQIVQKRLKQESELAIYEFEEINENQDWDFAFIAGYTSTGAPYGIRWKEMSSENE